jgi:hypothetical protein
MLANFFGKSKPVNFVFIIVLFLAYNFLDVFVINSSSFELKSIVNNLILFPGFFLLFFLYIFIITKNKLTFDNTYSFLLIVIGISCLPIFKMNYFIVGEYIVLLLLFRRVYSLRTKKSIYQKLFDSGLWLGLLFLLSPVNILYVILIYSAIFLYTEATVRTVCIPVLGFISPLILFFTYHFVNDTAEVFYKIFDINVSISYSFYNLLTYKLLLGVFGILTLTSVLLKSSDIFSVSNTFKKSWGLLIIHFFIAVFYILLIENENGFELFSLLIPSTIIIANWLQSVKKKLLIDAVLMLLLALPFLIKFIA